MPLDVDQPVGVEIGVDLLRRMLRIRRFEESVAALRANGELFGAAHLYIGQEAVAAGVCCSLRDDDYITSTHRGHGHVIAKGGDLGRCMAELHGKRDGYCKGKGGSMHIADMELGIIGANGIVGAGMPLAVGAALSAKLRGTDQVSVAFFGDGAANQGSFHESLNLAAIWSLPVLFVCENNGYSELTPMVELTALGKVVQRAAAYGIPGEQVDGNDASAVYASASRAAKRARRGEGPTLIEALTYRIREHSEGLDAVVGQTRAPEEVDAWRERDPVLRHRLVLEAAGVTVEEMDRIDTEVQVQVETAVEFARQAPAPEPQEAYRDLWAEPNRCKASSVDD